MKTRLSTDGNQTIIELLPENDFEISIINGLTTYKMGCTVDKPKDTSTPAISGTDYNSYLKITLNHK